MIKKNRYFLYFILITIGLLACINKATTQKEYTTISKSDSVTIVLVDTLSKREFLGSRLILDLLSTKRYSHLDLGDSLHSVYSIFYTGSKLNVGNQKFEYNPLKSYKQDSGILSYFKHFNFEPIYIFPSKDDTFKKVLFHADSAIDEEQRKILLPRLDIVSIGEDGKKIDELNLYYMFTDGIVAVKNLFFIDEEANTIYSITGDTDEDNSEFTDNGYKSYWAFDKIKKYTITEQGKFHLNE
ncbi:hypothetical protein [Bernardetia sp. MNP-M8]|uniref:hypothetical protein n=1 Tax=Bernardetia sp. MNP-M8 TaxID=3127470 RepID=UPI0030D3EEA1